MQLNVGIVSTFEAGITKFGDESARAMAEFGASVTSLQTDLNTFR